MQAPLVRHRGGLAPWQLRRVQELIDAHLGESISGQQMADCVRLSRCHFVRAFRQSTGMSPHGYVTRRRLERAQQLMLSTEATLLDIALECGLADQSHLSRTFFKLFGETPRSWRRARIAQSPVRAEANRRAVSTTTNIEV